MFICFCFVTQWYNVSTQRLPSHLASRFVLFNEDTETQEFLEACRDKSDWLFTELLHSFIKFALSWVMHQTSINGLVCLRSVDLLLAHKYLNPHLHLSYIFYTSALYKRGSGGSSYTWRPLPKIWCPLGRKFQTKHGSLPSLSCKHIFYKHA